MEIFYNNVFVAETNQIGINIPEFLKFFGYKDINNELISVQYSDLEKRYIKRRRIESEVADIPTLLGTIADANSIVFDLILIDLLSIDKMSDHEQRQFKIEQIKQTFNIEWKDFVNLANKWLEQRKTGAILTTVGIKGIHYIFDDIAKNSTQVTQIIQQGS